MTLLAMTCRLKTYTLVSADRADLDNLDTIREGWHLYVHSLFFHFNLGHSNIIAFKWMDGSRHSDDGINDTSMIEANSVITSSNNALCSLFMVGLFCYHS